MEQEQTRLPTEEWLPVPANLESGSTALSRRRAELWALVLEARGFPRRLKPGRLGWRLLVPAEAIAAALQELRQYERENRYWPPPLPPHEPRADNQLATLAVLILLAAFHNVTLADISLPGHNPVDWIALGNAHAGKILEGEWWRLVTSLTLHSGWLHLLSNLIIGGVFIVRLCALLGSGAAWALLLASGILGNLVNAWLQHPEHRAIGASTAVFGVIGVIAALNLVRYRTTLHRRWFLPIAAALGLLAFLGTGGENTDLGAHLFGFVSGLLLGLAAGYLLQRGVRPGRLAKGSAALAGSATVIAAWWVALFSV